MAKRKKVKKDEIIKGWHLDVFIRQKDGLEISMDEAIKMLEVVACKADELGSLCTGTIYYASINDDGDIIPLNNLGKINIGKATKEFKPKSRRKNI